MGNLKKPKTKTGNENAGNPSAEEDALQNPSVLVTDTQNFIEKYKNLITYIGLGIAVVVAAGVFYYNNLNEKEKVAQQEIFHSIYAFEADSLNKALNGDGLHLGFLDIISNYGGTDAGNLANFYAGVSYLKLNNYDEAITYLKAFDSDDFILQARANALIGDAYLQLKQPAEASLYYKKAVDYKPNKQFTPSYMLKLALAYTEGNNLPEAQKVYQKLIDTYPLSVEANDAKKYIAKVKNLQKTAS